MILIFIIIVKLQNIAVYWFHFYSKHSLTVFSVCETGGRVVLASEAAHKIQQFNVLCFTVCANIRVRGSDFIN
jgi:hypothetical protein